MRTNKNLVKIIGEISEINKQRDIAERDSLIHQQELRRLRQHSDNLEAEVVNLVYSAAILISQLRENGNQDMDRIFLGEGDDVRETRQTLAELVSRLRFLYLVDALAPLSPENMAIVNAFTPNWDPQLPPPGRQNND
jgi:hypothetical protein